MFNKLSFLMLLSVFISTGQETYLDVFSITPEILFGITGESNTNFPDRELQKQVHFSFGWHQTQNSESWTSYLKTTKTGISIGYTDFGNKNQLGEIITLQPFIEFNAFKSNNITLHIGTGASYITKKHDAVANEFNRAVSTNFNWSFRVFMYYKLLKTKQTNWRVGIGCAHNSNGHAKLPNQGYNSFLLSLNSEIITRRRAVKNSTPIKTPTKTTSNYFSIRSGYGQNVLSEAFGDKKNIYTLSGEFGKIYNSVFKLGVGAYFRFYETYYDYISNNESLVQEGREFSDLSSNAFTNALNIGLSAKGELLLNHFGIEIQGGINLYKPAYKVDWRINKGWGVVPKIITESGGNYTLGDINEPYYKVKRTISARLGLKYYVIGTATNPMNNVYIGAFINSNLGQADFSEIAMGYVLNLKSKQR